jgi:aspartate aminotransferase-like enzyme
VDREDGKRLSLFTPGPVDLSEAARRALARDVLHHRSQTFRRVLTDLEGHLQTLFFTCNPVVTLTSSGTGAMEASVTSLFSPGERVVVPVSGKFSSRWAEICRLHGIDVIAMDLDPGRSPDPADVVGRLEKERAVAGVFLTHCETSTGTLTDMEAVCGAVAALGRRQGRRFLVCVDCITSIAIDEFRMDDWHIDCAIGASQKGLLSPPGLAFVSASPFAIQRMAQAKQPGYYFDLRRYFEDVKRSPFTPAVGLVCAVRESIEGILDLGLPRIWQAYRASVAAIRLILEAADLEPVAVSQAGAVVAFRLDGLDADGLAAGLRDRHGIVVAHGQGDLRGKILRVSTIGKGPTEIRRFGAALASVLSDQGRSLRLKTIETELDRLLEETVIWESLR